MPASILCEVDDGELALLQKVRDFMEQKVAGGRSPKAHEIVPLKSRFKSAADKRAIKSFRRLSILGAIHHSPNGHCWLTRAGDLLLDKPDLIAEN